MEHPRFLRLSFEDWKKKFHNRAMVSCAVTFEDGWRGTYCFERYQSVANEIEMFKREHGEVSFITTTSK